MGKCRGCIAPTPSCPCFASATKGSCWSATSCVDCAGKYILPERGGACCVGLGHCWDDCGDIWLLVPVRGLHTNSAFLSETNTSLWAHPRSSSLQKGACQKFWHSSHRRQNLHQLLLQGRYTSANGLIAQVAHHLNLLWCAHPRLGQQCPQFGNPQFWRSVNAVAQVLNTIAPAQTLPI